MILEQPQELVYYQDQMVFFSSKRFIFSGQTFMPNSIISVSSKPVPGPRGTAWVLLAVGVVSFFMGIAIGNSSSLVKGNPTDVVFILAGIILFLVGGFKYLATAPHYALVLGTPGGFVETIKSPDINYITYLQNTINQILINKMLP